MKIRIDLADLLMLIFIVTTAYIVIPTVIPMVIPMVMNVSTKPYSDIEIIEIPENITGTY